MENIWFNERLKILDNSLELLKKEDHDEIENNQNENDDLSCARCRIYQRKKQQDSQLLQKIKHNYQIHHEHNYSQTYLNYSTPGFYIRKF